MSTISHSQTDLNDLIIRNCKRKKMEMVSQNIETAPIPPYNETCTVSVRYVIYVIPIFRNFVAEVMFLCCSSIWMPRTMELLYKKLENPRYSSLLN